MTSYIIFILKLGLILNAGIITIPAFIDFIEMLSHQDLLFLS